MSRIFNRPVPGALALLVSGLATTAQAAGIPTLQEVTVSTRHQDLIGVDGAVDDAAGVGVGGGTEQLETREHRLASADLPAISRGSELGEGEDAARGPDEGGENPEVAGTVTDRFPGHQQVAVIRLVGRVGRHHHRHGPLGDQATIQTVGQ